MVKQLRALRPVHLLATGIALMLTVSLATAAIVMWIPESPVSIDRDQKISSNLSEYVLLHRARNVVVPPYFRVDVDTTAH